MKTNFALGITESGVTLWQRGDRGWLRVGAVALDHDDMNTAVGELVTKARKLAGDDKILTQLVIPDDQILYTRISAPGPGDEAQRNQIRKALEGRTPFPVEELDFDWTGAGPDVDVAVVARETLIEAEDFAKAQNLNPVCFVAAPANGAFSHAPFFGSSRIIRDILGDPAKLIRDREILTETGVASLPPVAQKPDATPATPPAQKGNTDSDATPQKDADKGEQAKPAKVKDSKTGDSSAKVLDTAPKPEQRTTKDSEPAKTGVTPAAPAADKDPNPPVVSSPAPAAPPAGFKSRRSTDAPQAGLAASRDDNAKGKASLTGQKDMLAGMGAADGATDAPKPTQGLRATYASANARIAAGLGQLRSRLTGTGNKPVSGDPKPVSTPSDAVVSERPDSKSAPAAPVPATAPATGPRKTQSTKPETAQPPAAKKAASADKIAPKPAAPPSTSPKAAPALPVSERKTPLETLRSIGQTSTEGSQTSAREAERLTVFGARGNAAPQTGGGLKPRLLIGGGVIMILAAGAVWAFYFARPAPPEIPVTLAPPPEAALDTPTQLDGMTDTAEDRAIEAALGVEDVAERGPEADATAPDDNVSASPLAGDPDQIESSTAPSVEIEQGRIAGLRSSALIMPQDLSAAPLSPDAPEPFDAQSLPPLRSEVLALEAQPDDVPADIPADVAVGEPDLDVATDALVLPTGEEALEIDVTSGRPATAPPEKPVRFSLPETPAAETTQEPDVTETGALDPAPLQADPQDAAAPAADPPADLAAGQAPAPDATIPPDESDLEIVVTPGTPPAVPPGRPEGLQPDAEQSQGQAQPEDAETIQQAAATDADAAPAAGGLALSALRPATRPSDLTARAEAILEAQTPRLENATEQAVAASLRPTDRPSQFASTVQRALSASTAAAPATQSAPQAPVQTASAAAAQPSIPSSASVSREATQARAINLRQVNLIGVMGTSSNRRALVRMSNGRVVTVRVGESLDGGQVTAIGETELRYNRRGRDVVLRIAS
ncbi:hypothetical protein [Roseinatronobacter sp.]